MSANATEEALQVAADNLSTAAATALATEQRLLLNREVAPLFTAQFDGAGQLESNSESFLYYNKAYIKLPLATVYWAFLVKSKLFIFERTFFLQSFVRNKYYYFSF